MHQQWALAGLAALSAGVDALRLNPNGNAVGLALDRKLSTKPRLRRRGIQGTFQTDATWDGSSEYYINFTLGTPPQQLAAQIDTGSSDFWVTVDGECGGGCVLGAFNPNASSTWQVTQPGAFNTSYADGSGAAGDFGQDTMEISGLTLDNITVGVGLVADGGPTNETMTPLIGLGFDALQANAAKQINPTIIDMLVNSGKIDTHTFSLYLNDPNSQGTILFGGIDTAKFSGELGILDLQAGANGQVVEYSVAMTGMSFSNGNGDWSELMVSSTGATTAVLDSGTTDVAVPADLAYSIYKGLGLEYNDTGAFIQCDADVSGYKLNFTFGATDGKWANIGVPLSSFIGPPAGSDQAPAGYCTFELSPLSSLPNGGGETILGDSFLRGAYVLYDLDNLQVGIAPAIINATGSNIIAIGAAESASASGTARPTSVGTVSNIIPSATTIQDQVTLSAAAETGSGATSTPTGTGLTSASPTFKGIPSGGFTAASSTSTHKSAAGKPQVHFGMTSAATVLSLAVSGGMFVM